MTTDSGAGRTDELCSAVLLLYSDPWKCSNTHVGHEIHEARLADISVTWVTAKSVGTRQPADSAGVQRDE